MNENKQQLALFSVGSMIDDEIAQVFGSKAVKNAKGAEVGVAVGIRTRKEIAETLNLKGKDHKEELDAAILAQKDAAWLKVKAAISGLDANWTLARFQKRTMGDGVEQISIVTQRIDRTKKLVTAEKMAKQYGISIERAEEILKSVMVESAAASGSTEIETVEVETHEPASVAAAA